MRLAELSERTGVPVATVKFYLREGLLPAGKPVTARQSAYDDTHAQRLQLIRSLVEVNRAPLEKIRRILAIIDEGNEALEVMGEAAACLSPEASTGPEARARRAAGVLALRQLGFSPRVPAADVEQFVRALELAESAGVAPGDEQLRAYAAAALEVAKADLAVMPWEDPKASATRAVLGNMFTDPLVAVMRRMAQFGELERCYFQRHGLDPNALPEEFKAGPEWSKAPKTGALPRAEDLPEPVTGLIPVADAESSARTVER